MASPDDLLHANTKTETRTDYNLSYPFALVFHIILCFFTSQPAGPKITLRFPRL